MQPDQPWFFDHYWHMQRDALEALIRRPVPGRADLPEPKAALFGDEDPGRQPYQIVDGVALIPVSGPLLPPRLGWLAYWVGGTDYGTLAATVQRADRDPRVKALRLDIDSPGGSSSGLSVALQALEAAVKPLEGRVVGTCASAAYWLACACSRIVADSTAVVGSIGAYLAVQAPRPGAEVLIVASQSPRKVPRVDTEEGRRDLQELVDDLCDVFIGDVARLRGVSVDTVHERYGNGAVFVAHKALERGLIDGVQDAKENTMAEKKPGVVAALRDKFNALLTELVGHEAEAPADQAAQVETAAQGATTEEAPAQAAPATSGAAVGAGPDVDGYLRELETLRGRNAALQGELEQLKATRRAELKAAAVEGLLQSGRISPAERAQAELAWDAEQEKPESRMFSGIFAARAPNAALPLAPVGHPGDKGDPASKASIAKACRAMAKAEGISFETALERFKADNPTDYAAVYGKGR
jgi:capsid assembly protease